VSVSFVAVCRLCITKLDILDSLAEIKVGVSYKSKGKKINYFPSNAAELGSVEVCANRLYEVVHAWSISTGYCIAVIVVRWSMSLSLAGRQV
jgi:adenylosuccinate synthase